MNATDSVWEAITSAQNAHGDAAETFARGEAHKAAAKGDIERAATWQDAAEQLHTLHSINRQGPAATRVRPQSTASAPQ